MPSARTPSAAAGTLTALSGPVLFSDRFSDPANPNRWGGTEVVVQNTYTGGTHRMILTPKHSFAWSAPATLMNQAVPADVRVDVDARLMPGTRGAMISLLCDLKSGMVGSFYFYQFTVSQSPPSVTIAKVTPPQQAAVPRAGSGQPLPANIDLFRWNRFEAVCVGGRGGQAELAFAINGTPVTELTDTHYSLAPGAAGVMLQSTTAAPVQAAFDNFVLRKVQP